jgi:hypothetical protein
LIQKVSVFFVGDPDVIVAKVNRFGLVGRRFKVRVHIFVPGLKSSRNHKALLSAKLNQVRLDGEPYNPSGLVFAMNVVNARDELTKRQRLLLVIDLHGLNIGQETARAPWGVSLPEISKMAETNQPVTLLIPEPEGEGFEAGEQRDGRHALEQRLRLMAPLQIVIGNLRAQMMNVMNPQISLAFRDLKNEPWPQSW